MGKIIGRIVIDPGEKVKCNRCNRMIEYKDKWSPVYLLDKGGWKAETGDELGLFFPRCKECAEIEQKEEQDESKEE